MPASTARCPNLKRFTSEERRANQVKAVKARRENSILRFLKGEKVSNKPTHIEILNLAKEALAQVAQLRADMPNVRKHAKANGLPRPAAKSAKQPHPIDRDAHLLDQLTPPRLAR